MSTRFKKPIIGACILALLSLTGCQCARDYFAWNHTPPYDPTPENFGSNSGSYPLMSPGYSGLGMTPSKSQMREQLNDAMKVHGFGR